MDALKLNQIALSALTAKVGLCDSNTPANTTCLSNEQLHKVDSLFGRYSIFNNAYACTEKKETNYDLYPCNGKDYVIWPKDLNEHRLRVYEVDDNDPSLNSISCDWWLADGKPNLSCTGVSNSR